MKIDWDEKFKELQRNVDKNIIKDNYSNLSDLGLLSVYRQFSTKYGELSKELDKLNKLVFDIRKKKELINIELSILERKLKLGDKK